MGRMARSVCSLGGRMAGATQRGYKAGLEMGKAIIKMVHLMYQNNTAAHFYRGLSEQIIEEMERRQIQRS